MKKWDYCLCLCENKGADQLCSYCTADQHICFHYKDSTISLLKPKFQASSLFLRLYRPVCVGSGRKPRRPIFLRRGSNTHMFIIRLYCDYFFQIISLFHQLEKKTQKTICCTKLHSKICIHDVCNTDQHHKPYNRHKSSNKYMYIAIS